MFVLFYSQRLSIFLCFSLLLIVACGGGGGSDPKPPVANPASFSIDEDNSLTETLSGTASEGGNLSFQITTSANNGTVSLTGNEFEYVPNDDFFGTDVFRFQVVEGELQSAAVSVSITVNPINDAPVSTSASFELLEDGSFDGMLPASDIDNTSLEYALLEDVQNGQLIINTDGSFTYNPEENFFGDDSFEFTANDGEFTTTSVTVDLVITSVNDEPVAQSSQVSLVAGKASTIELIATDVEADPLDFEITETPEKIEINNDPSNSGLAELLAPYGTYGSDSLSFTASDQDDTSNEATVDLSITLAATQAVSSSYVYDAGGQLNILAINQDEQQNTLVLGNVRGTINDQSSSTPSQRFVAIHNNDNELTKTVYFGQGQAEYETAILAIDESAPIIFGLAGNEAYFVTLDSNYDVDLNIALTIPYAIDRANIQLTPVYVPGVGIYVLGNDNRVTWIDTSGVLRSTETIDNQMGYEINAWEVLDSKLIDNTVYFAGRFLSCNDEPADCFSGVGEASFLMTLNRTGGPTSVNQLQPQFADDLALLSDGRVVQQYRASLSLMQSNGTIEWLRTAIDGDAGNVAIGPEDDILWWNIDRETGNTLASRINSDNSIEWQTSQASEISDHYWNNRMLVDEYGNMYVSFVDRYNQAGDAFGAFVTMHFDYAGTHQWTERQQPSDLNPNTGRSGPWAILTEDRRILSIVNDNINAGGSDADGILLQTSVTEIE